MMPIIMPPNGEDPKSMHKRLTKEQRELLRNQFRADLAMEKGIDRPFPFAGLVCKLFGHAKFRTFYRTTEDGTPYQTHACSRCHTW